MKTESAKRFQNNDKRELTQRIKWNTVKDLTYETTDGKYRSVEYRDKLWHLEGGITWEKQN